MTFLPLPDVLIRALSLVSLLKIELFPHLLLLKVEKELDEAAQTRGESGVSAECMNRQDGSSVKWRIRVHQEVAMFLKKNSSRTPEALYFLGCNIFLIHSFTHSIYVLLANA